jgi:hypothetical protein
MYQAPEERKVYDLASLDVLNEIQEWVWLTDMHPKSLETIGATKNGSRISRRRYTNGKRLISTPRRACRCSSGIAKLSYLLSGASAW